MNEAILKEINRIKVLSDYTLREELKGFGFIICPFIKQFSEVGTKEYKQSYNYMFKELEVLYNRANKGIINFKVDLKYKNKRGCVFGWCCDSVEERTREEVLRRIKEMKFRNLNNNRIIKPIFIEININGKREVLK